MIEILASLTLFLLFWLLINSLEKKKGSSADEKKNNSRKQQLPSIVGASRFVMDSERTKQTEIIKPDSDSSGKLNIEVHLDYEMEDTDLLEEQEELKTLGLQNNYSSDITFDEMMAVVNEVENTQSSATTKSGEILYENENADWVEQLSSSSKDNAKRITSLIDLHLGRLVQPISNKELDDELMGFDIGEYVR